MSPLSYVTVQNREHFSQLGGVWQSLGNNEILLHIIDILMLVYCDNDCMCQSRARKTHFIILAIHTQSLVLNNKELLWCVNVQGELIFSSLSWSAQAQPLPLWILWENMAAKALHHTPHRTTAPVSFLQPVLLRKLVGVCVRKRERESPATIVYPHRRHLSPVNFSHIRIPRKLDSH